MAKIPFNVRAAARNIHLVDLDCTSKQNEWWFLLSGDRHHDNPHADHALELKHLEMARSRNAGIIDVGDMHCAMEGKFDPRRNKAGIREEHAMATDERNEKPLRRSVWCYDAGGEDRTGSV